GFVVAKHGDEVAVEQAIAVVGDELFEAMGLFAAQDGHATAFAFAVEVDANLHPDFGTNVEQTSDELVEGGGGIGDVDEHVHQELSAHHSLLDIFNVDVSLGEVGADAGDNALLITTKDGDDGQDSGHTI